MTTPCFRHRQIAVSAGALESWKPSNTTARPHQGHIEVAMRLCASSSADPNFWWRYFCRFTNF